jgi:site-specific recombinase XerC
LKALIGAPDMALRFAVLCAGEAGLRTGTTLRVRPVDVQDGYIVTRTKRGMVTKTPVSQRLAALLAVVPSPVDTRQTVFDLLCGHVYQEPDRELQKRWAAWKRKCGVRSELRLHDLRRGLARRLYAATGDLRLVQSLLSHDQLTSTLHYLDAADRRVTPQTLDAAIAAVGDFL